MAQVPNVELPKNGLNIRRFPADTLVGSKEQVGSAEEARLVDAFAAADEAAKRADIAKAEARKALAAFIGSSTREKFRSNRYLVTRSEQERTTLDTATVKRDMPADWIAAHSNTTRISMLKVTEL